MKEYITVHDLNAMRRSKAVDGPVAMLQEDWLHKDCLPCIFSPGGGPAVLAFEELMTCAKEGRIGAAMNAALQDLFLEALDEVRPDAGGRHSHAPEFFAWVEQVIQHAGHVLTEIGGESNVPDPERPAAPSARP